MKQLTIISDEEHEIERKLNYCVERLENTGVWVYATHRGRGCAVIWADDNLVDRAMPVLRDAGFDVAPLTQNRSPRIKTRALALSVSNQNNGQGALETAPEEVKKRH